MSCYKYRASNGSVLVEIDPEGFGRSVPPEQALKLADMRAIKNDFEGAASIFQAIESSVVLLRHKDEQPQNLPS